MSEYYISTKKLKKKKVYLFQTVFGAFPKNEWFYKYDDIHSIPAADVRENIHGHWIATPECDTCSECHFKVVAGFNFCPHCGADMRGET